MPRYFFNRTDGFVEHDHEGLELHNLSDARLHAIVFAGDTIRNDPERLWGGQELYVEVIDDRGNLLVTVKIECFVSARMVEGG